jgi:glycosyltransferase involved in cell wall biosynthesis
VRILHVITKLDVGGAQSILAALVREQMNSGHCVTIATGVLWPEAAVCGISGVEIRVIKSLVHPLRPLQDWRTISELKALIRKGNFDVIHTHSSKGGLLGRIAARLCAVPSVYTAHGWPFQPEAPRSQRIQSLFGEWVGGRVGNEIVCVSEAERSLATRLRVGRADHRHIIYNGIDPLSDQASRTGDSRPLRIATDPFRVVTVARLEAPKRVDVLVEAIAQVLAHGDTRITLTVVGDGSLLDGVRMLADSLGVSDRVRFVGQTNPLPHLVSADLFVLLSDYEGLPVTVLEAMRSGLPILTNRLAGVVETTGRAAGVVTELNASSVARAIEQLADNPQRCVALGLAGCERWEEQFTTAEMASRYEALYRLAVSRE